MTISLLGSDRPVIHRTNNVINGSHTITGEVLTLGGETQVRITHTNGDTIVIPYSFAAAFGGNVPGTIGVRLRSVLADQRMACAGDPATHSLTKWGDFNRWVRPEDPNPHLPGTPILEWLRGNDDSARPDGWRVYLNEDSPTELGFARWDDIDGIHTLAASLTDTDALFVLYSMIDSDSSARLASRIAATRLKAAKKIPIMSAQKVRAVLEGVQVPRQGNHATLARVGTLKVDCDPKAIVLAVAVTPYVTGHIPPSEEEAFLALPTLERAAARKQFEREAADEWCALAIPALAEAGWHRVDLPTPDQTYSALPGHVLWVTRVAAGLWPQVAVSANRGARNVRMMNGLMNATV